ncbi:MAG: glycogen synthase, partial [Actinomycetes bacterium]
MPYRSRVRIGLLTREYPPEVYGGAGVHVEHLVPALRELVDVDVHCFGRPRPDLPDTYAHRPPPDLEGANPAL